MTKSDQLLAALRAGRTVTRLTALGAMKIANLTAEIGTLRKRGHRIEAVTGPDGGGGMYTKWVYLGTVTQPRSAKITITPSKTSVSTRPATTSP